MALDLTKVDQKLLSCRPAKAPSKNIFTPICKLSFPVLFEAKTIGKDADADSKKKFSVSLLIPPDCNLDLLKKAATDAAVAEWGDKLNDPDFKKKVKSPFLQAGDYQYEGYIKGWILMRPTSDQKPNIAQPEGTSLVKITSPDSDLVYAGRWATVSLNAFTYEKKGNKGVAFGLNNIVLLNHDDSLGGRMKVEEEFDMPVDGLGDSGSGESGTVGAMF